MRHIPKRTFSTEIDNQQKLESATASKTISPPKVITMELFGQGVTTRSAAANARHPAFWRSPPTTQNNNISPPPVSTPALWRRPRGHEDAPVSSPALWRRPPERPEEQRPQEQRQGELPRQAAAPAVDGDHEEAQLPQQEAPAVDGGREEAPEQQEQVAEQQGEVPVTTGTRHSQNGVHFKISLARHRKLDAFNIDDEYYKINAEVDRGKPYPLLASKEVLDGLEACLLHIVESLQAKYEGQDRYFYLTLLSDNFERSINSGKSCYP